MAYNEDKQIDGLDPKSTIFLDDFLIVKGQADTVAKKGQVQQFLQLLQNNIVTPAGFQLHNTLIVSEGINDVQNRIFPTYEDALFWFDNNIGLDILSMNDQLTVIFTAGVYYDVALIDYVNLFAFEGAVLDTLSTAGATTYPSKCEGFRINTLQINGVTFSNLENCEIKNITYAVGITNNHTLIMNNCKIIGENILFDNNQITFNEIPSNNVFKISGNVDLPSYLGYTQILLTGDLNIQNNEIILLNSGILGAFNITATAESFSVDNSRINVNTITAKSFSVYNSRINVNTITAESFSVDNSRIDVNTITAESFSVDNSRIDANMDSLLSIQSTCYITNSKINNIMCVDTSTAQLINVIMQNVTAKDDSIITLSRACYVHGNKIIEDNGVINDEWV